MTKPEAIDQRFIESMIRLRKEKGWNQQDLNRAAFGYKGPQTNLLERSISTDPGYKPRASRITLYKAELIANALGSTVGAMIGEQPQ